jgi:type II secretory ATPase GspE/PulE/Tfp pilus assembly ATPase PilB-like protein
VQAAQHGIGRHSPLATITESSGLAEDQHRALDAILKSTGFITLFRGGAGTGKSFVLRAVQRAVDGSNRLSVVLAP